MSTIVIERPLHLHRGRRGTIVIGTEPETPSPVAGRVPRVARLLALAHQFEGYLQHGDVEDYAQLARLGRVTPARITQIMNLLNLAPDIQEAILFLPMVKQGRDPVILADLQPIAQEIAWTSQRLVWRRLHVGTG